MKENPLGTASNEREIFDRKKMKIKEIQKFINC
jgi:hypothetical protein